MSSRLIDVWLEISLTLHSRFADCDLCFIHGINDFGGKFAMHAAKFLDEGVSALLLACPLHSVDLNRFFANLQYRIVVPDLPSHGRSTGIHVHTPSMEALVDAVYDVIKDVALQDSNLIREAGGTVTQTRKTFVAGQSLGGFVAAYVCLYVTHSPLVRSFVADNLLSIRRKYGAPMDTELPVSESFRPTISGGMILCPMLAISPETRPPYLIELIARTISSFASALPLAAANKGKNSEDPTVEQQFEMDPQTYHGKLRVGTGLGILQVRLSQSLRVGQLFSSEAFLLFRRA